MKDFEKVKENYMTVNEALDLMFVNKVKMSQVWLRLLCGSGKVKSFKIFNSLVIPKTEVQRLIDERKKNDK